KMAFCTVADVRGAIDFPSSGAPISDDDITNFITQSEEEIQNIYKTMFGNVEKDATASSGTTASIVVPKGTFTEDQWNDYVVWVYEGTGVGQYRNIKDMTTAAILVEPNFLTNPDNTSKYRITKLGFGTAKLDGNGTKEFIVNDMPLVNLVKLKIDGTNITPTAVYRYNDSRLVLKTTAEKNAFSDNERQLVSIQYIYGVYKMPTIIKRLCIVISALRTLTAQIAGTYNDFTSVSLPGGFTGSKGEPFTNIRAALQSLQQEAKGIVYG
ncbi:unnamed protein product, partial [marine sediment metagenome]